VPSEAFSTRCQASWPVRLRVYHLGETRRTLIFYTGSITQFFRILQGEALSSLLRRYVPLAQTLLIPPANLIVDPMAGTDRGGCDDCDSNQEA